MVLKTCKWYINCLSGYDASIDIQRDLPRSYFEVDLSRSLSTILFVITSGDLNIDLTQKKVFFYKTCRSFNEQSNEACRLSLRFMVFEIWWGGGGRKALRPILSLSEPARNRVNPYMPITLLHLQVYICVIHEVRLGFSDFLLLISPGSRGQHSLTAYRKYVGEADWKNFSVI